MSKKNNEDKEQVDFLKDVVLPKFKLFHTREKEGYAKKKLAGGGNEIYKIKDDGFLEILRSLHYKEFRRGISKTELKLIQETCSSIAVYDSPNKKVYLRTAMTPKGIYVDMGDDTWKIVKITGKDCKIVKNNSIYFYRPTGYLSLPKPDFDIAEGEGFKQLRKFIKNLYIDEYRLMLCWLISSIRPSGPFPVLVLQGGQGVGKSTLMRLLRMLIDPFKAPIRSLPRTERDLVISAQNNVILPFDNVSNLKCWLPDAFCRLATGAGFSTRKLYSDGQEQFFDACRPIILNGIGDFVTKNDLASRSILLNLDSLDQKKRVTEQELMKSFRKSQPAILADIYRAVGAALKNIKNVKLDSSPRMADFAAWSCAASEKVKWTHVQFLEAYDANQKQLSDVCFDADIVAMVVDKFIRAELAWQGTATELLSALGKFDPEVTQTKYWPKSASKMSSRLRVAEPALQDKGIDIERIHSSRQRLIKLELMDKEGQLEEEDYDDEDEGN